MAIQQLLLLIIFVSPAFAFPTFDYSHFHEKTPHKTGVTSLLEPTGSAGIGFAGLGFLAVVFILLHTVLIGLAGLHERLLIVKQVEEDFTEMIDVTKAPLVVDNGSPLPRIIDEIQDKYQIINAVTMSAATSTETTTTLRTTTQTSSTTLKNTSTQSTTTTAATAVTTTETTTTLPITTTQKPQESSTSESFTTSEKTVTTTTSDPINDFRIPWLYTEQPLQFNREPFVQFLSPASEFSARSSPTSSSSAVGFISFFGVISFLMIMFNGLILMKDAILAGSNSVLESVEGDAATPEAALQAIERFGTVFVEGLVGNNFHEGIKTEAENEQEDNAQEEAIETPLEDVEEKTRTSNKEEHLSSFALENNIEINANEEPFDMNFILDEIQLKSEEKDVKISAETSTMSYPDVKAAQYQAWNVFDRDDANNELRLDKNENVIILSPVFNEEDEMSSHIVTAAPTTTTDRTSDRIISELIKRRKSHKNEREKPKKELWELLGKK